MKQNFFSGLLVILFSCFTGQLLAQVPANDNCSGAINIPIGTPPACGTGTKTGTSGVVIGNITNATPGNPYIYQTGCSGSSTTQNFPANDVWYSFVATGYQANITINSTFANPNVAFYSGTCASLGGGIGGCSVGSGGSGALTVTQLIPGTTYFIQVSGATSQTGTFTLTLNNSISCSACLVNSSITVNPPPTNGAYPPGTTVQICFHVSQFNTTNTNWFHGVQLTLGSCWDKTTLTTNVPNAAGTSGTWAYYPTGIGVANSVNWGPGWYFDYSPSDGNPKNNFGDLPSGPILASEWNFCATVKTSPVCNPGCDLSVTFNTSGDGESGSWSSNGCTNDQPAIFKAIGACCPPVMSMVPVNCFSTSTGTAIATPVGTVSPYTYNWTGPGGYSSSTSSVTGASTITNIPAGVYTVQIIDNNLCSTTNTVLVTQPTSITATPSFTNATCLTLGSASVSVSGGTPGYTYTWSPTGGNSASATNLSPGTYTVTINDSKLCPKTATVTIAQTGTVSAAFSTPTPTQCLTGNSYVFTASVSTGTHTYSFNPTVGAPPTGNSATYGPVSFTAPGTYTVIHTIVSGVCTNTATSIIVINPQPTVTANNNSPACVGGSVIFSGTGGGTYSWSGPGGFTSAIQNPTLSPISLSNAGVYTLTVTLNGCTGTATTSVSISNPTASATNTGPYCVGTTIQLNSSAATSYTWSGPGGFTSNLQNPTISNATAAMAGTYTVNVSLGVCSASAITSVTINPLPVPVAGNTGPYCPGTTIQLNVGAFPTYTWSGPGSFSSNLQNPTQANAQTTNGGVYTVSVTDANGCVNSSTTNVVVNPTPVVVIGSNSPVCLNASINLNASGGSSYAWSGPGGFTSALQNPTIPNATTANAGVYTVTVTALGCINTGTVSVTVLTPTTTANNSGPFCAGTTIQLSTPAASTYTWTGPLGFTSNSQNPSIPLATVGMAGTYSVIVAVGSCTANATTNVIVNALPTPTAGSNSPICNGTTLILSGSSATSYTWTGPNSFGSNTQNPTIPSASTTASGTYIFSVTDANNCTNSVTTVVVVNANPVIAVNNPTVCLNQTINLAANGGSTYSWSGPNSFVSSLQNPSIPNAAMNMNGAYTVTVTTAQGCTNTAVATVSVYPLPIPNIVSNSPVCVGGQLTLNGNGGSTYQWNGPNSFNSTSQNPVINPVTLNANGVYTLIASAGTCSASTTATIVINPLPNPNIVSNSPVCIGMPINFTGSGGVSYSWSGPGGFSDTTSTPVIASSALSNAGTYTLTVTDANGCVNSITGNVVVNPQPVVSASGSTVCANSNAQLNASGGLIYSWSGPGGYTSSQQNPTLPNVSVTSGGQYTVIVTNANTCTNTATANLVVNPAPVPNLITNSPICINNNLMLSATGGTAYAWTGPNGFSSSVQNPTMTVNTIAYSGNYQVVVTAVGGCTASANANVIINPNPVPSITAAPNAGCAPLCVNFAVSSVPSVTTASWVFGNGSSTVGVNANSCYGTAGIYTVSALVTDQNGCPGSATYTVEVYPQPVADFNHAPLKPIVNIDQEVTFTDASWGTPIVGWNWYFMNTAQYTSTLQNPTFMYTEPGTYAVVLVVKSDKGCLDTLIRPLVVGEDFGLYVPNTFTPNEDGLNDIFQPKGFGIVKYELFIYDRWGEKVFQTKEFTEGWNGTFQGRGSGICEESVYTWLIECTDVFGKSHELKGHVTLLR